MVYVDCHTTCRIECGRKSMTGHLSGIVHQVLNHNAAVARRAQGLMNGSAATARRFCHLRWRNLKKAAMFKKRGPLFTRVPRHGTSSYSQQALRYGRIQRNENAVFVYIPRHRSNLRGGDVQYVAVPENTKGPSVRARQVSH